MIKRNSGLRGQLDTLEPLSPLESPAKKRNSKRTSITPPAPVQAVAGEIPEEVLPAEEPAPASAAAPAEKPAEVPENLAEGEAVAEGNATAEGNAVAEGNAE